MYFNDTAAIKNTLKHVFSVFIRCPFPYIYAVFSVYSSIGLRQGINQLIKQKIMAFGTVVTTGGAQGNLLRLENITGDVAEGWQLGMILTFEAGEGITATQGAIYTLIADSSDPTTIDCTITSPAGTQAVGRLSLDKLALTIGTNEWGSNVPQNSPITVPIAKAATFKASMRGTIPVSVYVQDLAQTVPQDTLFNCAVVYNGNNTPVWVDFLTQA